MKDISSSWSVSFKTESNVEIQIVPKVQSDEIVEPGYEKTQFTSMDGVKLFRPFKGRINTENMGFSPVEIDDNEMIQNLVKIISLEYANIKELTDFEEGLRFALHSQLELKQMQYEYLKNPMYAQSENMSVEHKDFVSEDKQSIVETIHKLIESLIQQEQSEINVRLYYEKVKSSFELI